MPTSREPRPELRWTWRRRSLDGVVIVVHGGAETSEAEPRWWRPAVLRMLPVASAIARVGRGRLGVVRLKLSVRGWNADGSVVRGDLAWALDRVRESHPGIPIGLVGHSLGGRLVLKAAAGDDVRAVVALAPWIEREDDAVGGPGVRILLVHGDADRITSPRRSAGYARALAARGVDAEYVSFPGEGHALLRRAAAVHRLTARWLRDALR